MAFKIANSKVASHLMIRIFTVLHIHAVSLEPLLLVYYKVARDVDEY